MPDRLRMGVYYEVVAEGAHTQKSVVGRYRGRVALKGITRWWFETDAFDVLVLPEQVVELRAKGQFWGRAGL